MWQERLQRYILPGGIEQDPGFRSEIQRLSNVGLRVVGGAEIAVTLFMASVHMLLDSSYEMFPIRGVMLASTLAVGVLTMLAAKPQQLYPHARLIAATSALLV